MIRQLLRKYRWALLALFLLYAGISAWLFFLADAPQSLPFVYQID